MEKRNLTYNFSAGPGPILTEVLLQAQQEFLDYQGLGMNFMEMSHRDPGPVQDLMTGMKYLSITSRFSHLIDAVKNLRSLLNIPETYEVLFFHGGAHAQVCLSSNLPIFAIISYNSFPQSL